MKALIAAGGRATRLRPITNTTNKHLIPLANKPMILYAIEKVREINVTDIYINVNPGEQELQKVIGDGSKFGVHATYVEQEGGPKGLAHIVKNAQRFLGNEPFVFYLGDNIVLGSLRELAERFAREELDAMFAFTTVKDPQRFGVPEIVDGKLVRIVEKPTHPSCNLAQTGIYFYRPSIFQAVSNIPPSARGEYEISDANTYLIEHGGRVGWKEMTGWWKDTGKPVDLLEGNQLLLAERAAGEPSVCGGVVEEGAMVQGKVWIGEGSLLRGKTLVRGPVVIGKNCLVEDAYIGPYTSIGDGVKIQRAEIEHSIVLDHAEIRGEKRVVDSIIGYHASVVSSTGLLPRGHRFIIGDHTTLEF